MHVHIIMYIHTPIKREGVRGRVTGEEREREKMMNKDGGIDV